MKTLVFDEYDFAKTAEVVSRINSFTSSNPEDIVSYMKGMAYQYLSNKSSYCGTLGFYLTAFDDIDDPTKRHVRANVSAHLVLEYLSKKAS